MIKKSEGVPGFVEMLERMEEIHLKKNADYSNENKFFNFDFTKFVLQQFKNDRDKVYVWPIACKLARLSVLLSSDKEPNNESIEDSLIDIANYIILWKCDIQRRS